MDFVPEKESLRITIALAVHLIDPTKDAISNSVEYKQSPAEARWVQLSERGDVGG